MTWSNEALETVIATLESGSRPTGGASIDGGEVLSIGGENILQSGGVTLEDVKRVPVAFFNRMTKGHLRDNDVLINKDGAQTGKVGWYHPGRALVACINEHVFLLRGDPDQIMQGYLYYSLLSDLGQAQIRLQISGSAQPGIKTGFTKGVNVDIPADLREQSMIVRVLSTVDRAIEETEALIAKQQRIKTGLMQDLLTRGIDEHGNLRSEQTHEFKDSPLGRIPVEWDPMPLGSCGQWFSGGTPSKAIRRFWGGGVPWVCPKDMKQFELHQSIDTITGDAVAAGARLMPTGTVFIVIRGMILAHTFPVGVSTTEVAFNQDVKAIVPKQGLMGRYLAYWLSSHSHQFLTLATTATHGTKRFDMDELQAALVGVPLPNEQKHIVRIFDEQQSVIEWLQGLTAKLQAEKRGLMDDLLTGDRRVTALLGSPRQVVGA